jgi:hypothetical protein
MLNILLIVFIIIVFIIIIFIIFNTYQLTATNITATNITSTGALKAGDTTVNGTLTATNITSTGALKAGDTTVNGTLTATNIKSTGGVTAEDTTVNGTLIAKGNVQIGAPDKSVLLNNNLLFSNSWSGYPDSNNYGAEICNAITGEKKLMIVGNKSDGDGSGLRKIGLWDNVYIGRELTVEDTLKVKYGKFCIGNTCIDESHLQMLTGQKTMALKHIDGSTTNHMDLPYLHVDSLAHVVKWQDNPAHFILEKT